MKTIKELKDTITKYQEELTKYLEEHLDEAVSLALEINSDTGELTWAQAYSVEELVFEVRKDYNELMELIRTIINSDLPHDKGIKLRYDALGKLEVVNQEVLEQDANDYMDDIIQILLNSSSWEDYHVSQEVERILVQKEEASEKELYQLIYDYSNGTTKGVYLGELTVGDLKDILGELPQDAKVYIDGSHGYIYTNKYGDEIIFDSEDEL